MFCATDIDILLIKQYLQTQFSITPIFELLGQSMTNSRIKLLLQKGLKNYKE